MAIELRKLEKFSTNVRYFNYKTNAIRTLLKMLWSVSPAIAVSLVKKHVFSPADYRTGAEEEQILNKGSKFEVDVNGKTIRGWKWGAGPGILFVHGWNGRGIQLSRFFTPLINAGYAVIAFDAPGHGESDGKTSSYFEWTDTVRTLLKPEHELNIIGMIGHSLGGAAIINALSKEDISVPGVLIAPAIRLKDVLFNAFDLFGIPEVVYRKAIKEFENRFGYTLEKDDPWKLLPMVKSKFLIVHDRQDRSIPFMDSHDMAAKRPNVMLHETAGLGHRNILRDRKIVELATDYILGHSRPFHKQQTAPDSNAGKIRSTGLKPTVQLV